MIGRGRMAERGVTLIELMIAMVVFGVVIGSAVNVFRSQTQAFHRGADRMTVLQNLRYAANTLQGDLRTAGSNVPPIQPFLVYADDQVVAVSTDYTTNVADDPFAVFYDPDAPTGEVTALRVSRQITLPKSSFVYPTGDYLVGGINSPAETIIFFFSADSSTSRGDDFALFRQVNDGAPELVARNLLKTGGQPFFEFIRVREGGSGPEIAVLPHDSLPLAHLAARHGSAGDTARSAWTDSLRAIRVRMTATNGAAGGDEILRTLTRVIRFSNADKSQRQACGDEPIFGNALAAAAGPNPGDPITLGWAPAIDDGGGEKDVVRYVVYRRLAGAPDWGDPFLSIPSGQGAYTYGDGAVVSGQTYVYAVAAQDCTPLLSGLSVSAAVVAP
jgi:prepilin-type N-terminal cleavage/methylation domain-containing protein